MKNENIRRLALSLAATSIISTFSGCNAKKVNIPETAEITTNSDSESTVSVESDYSTYLSEKPGIVEIDGQEFMEAHDPTTEFVENEYNGISYENGLSTSELYFIRANGKVYLATKLVDVNENNIISKFYAIDTGEFLGQVLDINWYARSLRMADNMRIQTQEPSYNISVDNDFKDKNYFNGEYGIGKNLFAGNVIPASSVISDEKLSKEQIDALLSDNLYATCIVEKYLYNYIIYNKESYVFSHVRVMPRFSTLTLYVTWAFNGTTEHYTNDLQQFTIDDNNTVRKIIGYRSSVNKNDSGFNYLYNIESSKYIDLSQVKLLDTEKMLAPYNTERVRDELDCDYYRLDFLDLVYTGNLEGDDVFEKYYITKPESKDISGVCFYQVIGDDDTVSITGSFDGASLALEKDNFAFTKVTPANSYAGVTVPLKKCLELNGMSYYEKYSYSSDEISFLLNKLRSKDLDLGKTISETSQQYKKINVKDIIVIDTTKENNDEVLVDNGEKYYILIPSERKCDSEKFPVIYYDVCNYVPAKSASISVNGNYALVDDYLKTYYAAISQEGKLESLSSLGEVLRDCGLDDYIRDEYALIDLQDLAIRINEKQKQLKLK